MQVIDQRNKLLTSFSNQRTLSVLRPRISTSNHLELYHQPLELRRRGSSLNILLYHLRIMGEAGIPNHKHLMLRLLAYSKQQRGVDQFH